MRSTLIIVGAKPNVYTKDGEEKDYSTVNVVDTDPSIDRNAAGYNVASMACTADIATSATKLIGHVVEAVVQQQQFGKTTVMRIAGLNSIGKLENFILAPDGLKKRSA
jgi:hypothetical protein